MAATSPAKTRATRARTAAKKTAAADMDAPPRKAVIAKAAASRRAKIAADIDDNEVEAPPGKRKTTKKVATPTPAPLTAAPRRRVKVTPLDAPAPEPESATEEVPEEPKSKTTRSKKAITTTKSKAVVPKDVNTVSATKSRSKKATAPEEKVEEETAKPKTRGRPKKAAEPTEGEAPAVEALVRQTRTRAGSAASASQSIAATVPKAATGTKKKVTFEDLPESDKENVPLPSKKAAAKKTATTTATGMRAKPVRKPAATTTRRKAASSKTKRENTAPRALTPKKITQVARSSGPDDHEEDELNGGKTPVRDLSMSPRRMPGHLSGLSSPVKKLDFTPALPHRSPEKAGNGVSGILSPARRPLASPFKDALRESPKRGDAVPIFPAALQTNNTVLAALNTAQSALLQSPKRGPLDNSMFAQSALKPQNSQLKTSLLQSPARRFFSPQKQNLTSTTPARAQTKSVDANESPNTAISCHFRASLSPEQLARVHTLTNEEFVREAQETVDFDESVLNIRSPVKLSKPFLAPSVTLEKEGEAEPIIQNDLEKINIESTTPSKEPTYLKGEFMFESDPAPGPESMEAMMTAVTGSELELQSTDENVSNSMFRASKFGDDDESSEDELQADMTPERPFPTARPSLSAANFRSRLSTGVSGLPQGVGFTPLVSQLSGWRAGSPLKKGQTAYPHCSGMFSPAAAQHVPGLVQVSRQSTPQQLKAPVGPRKSGPRQSTSARKLVGSRLSMTSSVSATPGKSFFADEMALRGLEQRSDEQETCEEEIDLHATIGESMPPLAPSKNTGNETNSFGEGLIAQEAREDELTTDLINQTMYTDTALVDMAALAKEAEDLAPAVEQPSQLSSTSSIYGDENAAPAEAQGAVAEEPSEDPIVDLELASTTPTRSPVSATIQLDDNTTPVRPDLSLPRFVNTIVSKVPLRPEGNISPIRMPKKRSRSLSAGPGSAKRPAFSMEKLSLPRSNSAILQSPQTRVRSACRSPAASTPGQRSFAVDDFGDSTLDGIELPDDEFVSDEEVFFEDQQTVAIQSAKNTPATTRSCTAMPTRTPLKAVGSGVLHGAVVHVDVHTTEGADASGIFVELLTQMGAKCVKDWRWNPRASMATAGEEGEAAVAPTPAKVGITHVVYKDGGKRTLEKVRDARGEVWCVGVGWVLDCERENKWLDESTYAIDTTIIPRGGSRRRKSMEPKVLMNTNGSLGIAKGRRSVSGEMTSQMREELVNTPVRAPATAPRHSLAERESLDSHITTESGSVDSTFSTPTGVQSAFKISIASATAQNDEADEIDEDESENLPLVTTPTGYVAYDPATDMSPSSLTTPYLIGKGSKLVQMSCPPKQSGKGIFDDGEKENFASNVAEKKAGFPVTDRVEDEKDEGMWRRLEAARRRTMGWRPRVGSPLGRMP